jgi:hypothetical protein
MKSTIKKLLRESLLGEARATINDLNNLILIHQKGDYLLLYDPINKIPIGYIAFVLNSNDNVYPIYGIYSKNGYGPILYELAMTYVYPNGITLDDGSPTSREAINVWDKFYSRSDIKKEPINRNKKTYKEQDLIAGCNGDNECLKEVNHILFLHNLKFSYNLGKPMLDKLISNGNEFLKQNTNLDLQSMIYDLEGAGGR